jgi:hypothetical protein
MAIGQIQRLRCRSALDERWLAYVRSERLLYPGTSEWTRSMERLIEQPVDEGEVFEGAARLGRVQYHLAVYQHFARTGDESARPNFDVEGRITAVDALDLAQLYQRASELTLHLADGRLLDFLLANEQGTIRSTGRGLYTI